MRVLGYKLVSVRIQPHVLAIVLAGGEGKRLFPLTADRAKPPLGAPTGSLTSSCRTW